MIPKSTIQQIQNIPIEKVCRSLGIELQSAGANYKSRCPFHDERTPSFVVSPSRNLATCFGGCGSFGPIDLVMKLNKLSFVEAVKELAVKNGIRIEEKELTPEHEQKYIQRKSATIAMNAACEHYRENLESEIDAFYYTLFRCGGKYSILERFRIGYARDEWKDLHSHLTKSQFNPEVLKAAGLVKEKPEGNFFDVFRARIVFPICDERGEVIAFSGRIFKKESKEEPKYLNTAETDFYKKSEVLFGYHLAKEAIQKENLCYIVEGNFDVVAMHVHGYENSVAGNGTALHKTQLELIKRLTKNVCLCYDGDEAGRKAMHKNARLCIENGFNVEIILIPIEKAKLDPETFFAANPEASAFRHDYVKFSSSELLEGTEDDPAKKTEAIKQVCNLIALIKEPSMRTFYIDWIAKKHAISKKILQVELGRSIKQYAMDNDTDETEYGDHTPQITVVENFIKRYYEVRYNDISNQFEYKKKEEKAFEELNENTIYRNLQKAHIKYSMSDLVALLKSDFTPHWNPFREYFENLPEWDGEDHILKLSAYIDCPDKERFQTQFRKMFVRSVACSLEIHWNKHAFILVGTGENNQNMGKSTFCRWLCPEALQDYYAEGIGMDKDSMIALTENFIINLDELATFSKLELTQLKSIMSKDKIKVRIPYERRPAVIQRRCNFVGSTNEGKFLADLTGNVRWIAFKINKIDFDYKKNFDINALWAQAYHLLKNGYEYQLTAEEIKLNEIANEEFMIHTPEMEILPQLFVPADETNFDRFLTASDFVKLMSDYTDRSIKFYNNNVGKALIKLGFRQETRYFKEHEYSLKGYYVRFTDALTRKLEEIEKRKNGELPPLPDLFNLNPEELSVEERKEGFRRMQAKVPDQLPF